jgi:transposase
VLNLNTAFDNFFNPKLRARFPTFKRRHGKQSSYHCVGVKVLDGAIKIPKLSYPSSRPTSQAHGFVTKLQYKAKQAGKHLVKLDPWYASSKTCYHCGYKEYDAVKQTVLAMPLIIHGERRRFFTF